MPEVSPFRGVRYDVARVGTLSDVVAPPYDVIDPALQDQLYQASPYNVIRLELNREEPGDSGPQDRYTRAARFLKDWLRQGILREEDHPALYVYEQTFEVEGVKHTRKGFLARVRLEPFGQGKIYPHEQTLAGPKADRLALYQATGFNLSPIFGLYPDADGRGAARARSRPARPHSAGGDRPPRRREPALGRRPTRRPTPLLGGLMAGKPVFIADGHHRYETGAQVPRRARREPAPVRPTTTPPISA